MLDEELALATELARRAGAAILAIKQEARAGAHEKPDDQGPVTAADLAADAVIREGLTLHFGADALVTEETWQSGAIGAHPRAWFIDPLDGTEDFVHGRADYVVQIGLCLAGVPALGVLYQPETGICWRGVVGERCERIDANGTVHARDVRAGARGVPARPRIAISVSHPSQVVDFIVEELGSIPVPRGSVGLKIGMIVDGDADAYLTASTRIKVWDTCAPAAVLLAAGGVVTALDQSPLRYDLQAPHGAGVCAWTPAARAALLQKLNEARTYIEPPAPAPARRRATTAVDDEEPTT